MVQQLLKDGSRCIADQGRLEEISVALDQVRAEL